MKQLGELTSSILLWQCAEYTSRVKNGDCHILQTLLLDGGYIVLLTNKKTHVTLVCEIWSKSYLHVHSVALTPTPKLWKSRKQIADSHLMGR